MKVSELLDSPEKWTQDVMARDARNYGLERADDIAAVKWCLVGAVEKCYDAGYEEALDKLRKIIFDRCRHGSICLYNDKRDRTFEEIRELILSADV